MNFDRNAVEALSESEDQVPQNVILAFAPLHKSAFGMGTGMVLGLVVFGITLASVVLNGELADFVALLSQYFVGYTVTWTGAFVGLFWGWFVGFVAGWFIAFARNLVMAASFWIGRTREELRATRDFLDHI